jgi:isochorismate pyruvate lyase
MYWSVPLSDKAPLTVAIDARTAPEDCQSMVEVRQGVDALDRALVTLLAERQRYMEAAARIKPNREAVFDQARIDDVVAKVLVASQTAGLSSRLAKAVWLNLIEQCIAHEHDTWDEIRLR